MPTRRYTVLVDAKVGVSDERLAEQLQKHGFVVEQQLAEIGVLIGNVDEDRVADIRAIHGVAAVEEEREIEPI